MKNVLLERKPVKLTSLTDSDRTREFIFNKILGEGASCIAYQATDTTSRLPVIVKECFPSDIAEKKDGAIIWKTPDDENRAKERFSVSFETQRRIQSFEGLQNTSTHLIDGMYSGNNTLYTITDIQNADTYDEKKDSSLQEICKTIKSVAEAIGKYHDYGYLHLDIKPQNLLIFPETRETIRLLDFDSIVKKSDILFPETVVSYSQAYAAPEQLQGKRNKLCEATDIYGIGAVMFSRIMGNTPSSKDRSTFSDWDLSRNPFTKKLSNKAHRLLKEILHKTLSATVQRRYQNASELINALDELIGESDPKCRYLNSTCPKSLNYFTGRTAELCDIRTGFSSSKRVVFLYGIGGLGKTELALHYANQYISDFDVVAFGRYSTSLDDLFKNSDFISIENNAEGEISINSVKSLVDDRTLLIIDNFDTDNDPILETVLSLKCKILFTSRSTFKDLYPTATHIQVNELPCDSQLALFEYECDRTLSVDESKTVQHILKDIEGYTC